MSTSVMPMLRGLTYPAVRTPIFKTSKPQSISGRETAIARWAYPRYRWQLSWSLLRQGQLGLNNWTEFSQLEGFFEKLQGGFDSWLYTDPNDNVIASQPIGTGDGVTTNFPLIRSFGGHVIPITAPNLGASYSVSVNGTVLGSGYSITPWGTTDAAGPGIIKFTSAPGSSAPIAASFSYYFPCRFDNDSMDFSLFLQQMYEVQKTSFTSIK